jgi:hypothetical protein
MTELQATAVMIFFFVLRCMLPFALTLLIGYLMNKLVARWQAEEKATPAPVMTALCWEEKNCPPIQRNSCPAYLEHQLPCWQLKTQMTGSLPEPCLTCALYARFIAPTPSAPHPAKLA